LSRLEACKPKEEQIGIPRRNERIRTPRAIDQ
jgi:hypothetical protein